MNTEFSKISYKRNFLENVICRLDFKKELSDESFSLLAQGTEISKSFPIRGKDQIENTSNVNVVARKDAAPVVSAEKTTLVRKEFTDTTGKNKYCFSKKYVILAYEAYKNFENLKIDIENITTLIYKFDPDITITRFGLRYINKFDPDTIRIFKNYFSQDISCFIAPSSTKINEELSLSRVIGHFEYISDDIRLNANIGAYNRNYPGVLQKQDIALDYDAVVQGPCKLSEVIPEKLLKAHDIIQATFEHHITNKLRSVMMKGSTSK